MIAAAISCGPAGPICAATAAAGVQELEGRPTGDVLKAFALTFAESEAFHLAGDFLGPQDPNAGLFSWQTAQNVLAHGFVGGTFSIGDKGGFFSGFVAAGMGSLADAIDVGSDTGNTVVHAVAGGVGSELGGGKFADGAVTGAFGYLFNRLGEGHQAAHNQMKLDYINIDNQVYISNFFAIWTIDWKLTDGTPASDGIVMQHIVETITRVTDFGNPKVESYNFWETFDIIGGHVMTTNGEHHLVDDTIQVGLAGHGSFSVHAEARFYPGEHTPPDFTHGNLDTLAGDIPSSTTDPHLPTRNATQPSIRDWNHTW